MANKNRQKRDRGKRSALPRDENAREEDFDQPDPDPKRPKGGKINKSDTPEAEGRKQKKRKVDDPVVPTPPPPEKASEKGKPDKPVPKTDPPVTSTRIGEDERAAIVSSDKGLFISFPRSVRERTNAQVRAMIAWAANIPKARNGMVRAKESGASYVVIIYGSPKARDRALEALRAEQTRFRYKNETVSLTIEKYSDKKEAHGAPPIWLVPGSLMDEASDVAVGVIAHLAVHGKGGLFDVRPLEDHGIKTSTWAVS